MSSTAVTTRGAGGVLRLPGLDDLPVPVLLRHRADEPSQVRLVALLGPDDSAELVVDRALLAAGLAAPVTDGDVQVAAAGDRLRVTVAGLGLELALADVVDLLRATEPDRVIALVDAPAELSRA